jgi:hypothetical protein
MPNQANPTFSAQAAKAKTREEKGEEKVED